ncbi:interferon-induced very large GTPase 1-like [Ornithorhynchus anatinus]|uniref:interferon-induced very large GTPase 1-like n=1 Tax=Ornithorhynchus anatinus TaxID=9258 RepID=UPI0019D43901|nr:interferon-induced very large GTPase 1-like [Ornithorhynchus anatinus]
MEIEKRETNKGKFLKKGYLVDSPQDPVYFPASILGPTPWSTHFALKSGDPKCQILQYLDQKDVLKPEPHIQHTWEKQALEKLLSLSHSRVRDLESTQANSQEVIMRKNEKELQEAITIPPQCSEPSEKPQSEITEDNQRQPSIAKETLTGRKRIPDKELLSWASRGLALQGIYLTDNPNDLLEQREPLIRIPEDFALRGPGQQSRFEKKEFSSSQAEASFTQKMEKLGFSLSCSATSPDWGCSWEAGLDSSKSSESKGSSSSLSGYNYICTAKFSYVPLASAHLVQHQLRLSQEALGELKHIEDLGFVPLGASGPLHLGGIFWWKAVVEGFREEQREDVRQQACNALESYIRCGDSVLGVKATVGVGGSRSHSEMSFKGKETKSLQTAIQLSLTMTGGPPGVDSVSHWKAGLVASNKTWCVIDRGQRLLPVWDLILSNHRKDFRDVLQVNHQLAEAYTDLTGISVEILEGEELQKAMEDMNALLDHVKAWEETEPKKQLLKVIDFKKRLKERTENDNLWINQCLPDERLQNFLIKIVSKYENSLAPDVNQIKSFMTCLLTPQEHCVENFPQLSSIIKWSFHLDEQQEMETFVCSLDDFLKVLQRVEDNIQETAHVPGTSMTSGKDTQRNATVNLSKSFRSLWKNLREMEQRDEEMLLLCIAINSGYSVEIGSFQGLLGIPEISFMKKEMKKALEKFLMLRNEDTCRAEAFLLLTGLTAAPEGKVWTSEEKMKKWELMKNHLGSSLSSEISDTISKYFSPHDWEALEGALKILIDKGYDPIADARLREMVVRELENVHQGQKQENTTTSESAALQSHANPQEGVPKQDFQELIRRLGLQKYFPRKMQRADFQVINDLFLGESQPDSESDLPFCILQKLMMLDCQARYLVCRSDEETISIDTPHLHLEKVSDILANIFGHTPVKLNDSPGPKQTHLHPMDVQMAIFHCADNFRQYMFSRLSACQFALPLLVPSPCSAQIEFPLWAFCQVKKEWQNYEKSDGKITNRKCNNKLIRQVKTPVVSFLRLGMSASSKSQILNALLSKQRHNIFFHRHCRNSSKNCLLLQGVAEISWYCPGGKEDDRFDCCVAFTNLRGNAKEHEKQIRFLQEITSVYVIFLSSADHDEKDRKVIEDLLCTLKTLILVWVDKEVVMNNNSETVKNIAIKNKNEAELITELTAQIKSAIDASKTFYSLDACAAVAQNLGFLLDEDEAECKEGKELAEKAVSLLKNKNFLENKDEFLPLQGDLWHRWCENDKQLTNLRESKDRSIEQHQSQTESKKLEIRHQQVQKAFPLNDLMKLVLSALYSQSGDTKLYFLHWLKVFIEELSSDHLTELHQDYHKMWSEMQTNKNCQKNLQSLAEKMRRSTFGLEHILREIGQIYEAVDETLLNQDRLILRLPQIVADLMLAGYPMELMDGDTSYVPLKWVTAVFGRLTETLKDKRLFVLSVLGLQSSGKSTLLNTMFGLQFAVSAGRCTRGAYMHLLKVEEKVREHLGFDFVLVIDTEGLRAPELASKPLNHDNKLATFVIGLGNLTVINIFGENPSEMQDILQIAVQAFLRMKQVRLSPSCVFVHQNVGGISAEEKTREGRRCLQQTLDKMAIIAGKEESYEVTGFNDVIRFNVNTHVHYFSHLWEGDPPMAPPNPSYSHNIQDLKSQILKPEKENQHHYPQVLRMTEFTVHFRELWKALLNENFVFSFKNSLEISAYNKLESQFSKWTWELRSHMLDVRHKLGIQIKNEKCLDINRSLIENQIEEKFKMTMDSFQVFFKEHDDHGLLVQWRASSEKKLLCFKQELVDDIYKQCKIFMTKTKHLILVAQKKQDYKDELLKRSKDLVVKFNNQNVSEPELREEFDKHWDKWIDELSAEKTLSEKHNIIHDMETFLRHHFQAVADIENRIQESSKWTCVPYERYEEGKKLQKIWSSIPFFGNSCSKDKLKKTTQLLEKQMYDYILEEELSGQDYSPHYFAEIVAKIKDTLETQSTETKFPTSYQTDVCLFLCHKATKRLNEMSNTFQKYNDPTTYLTSHRDDLFFSFQIYFQAAISSSVFADFLCNKLKEAIRYEIYEKTAKAIADQMKKSHPAFRSNRSKLEFYMLKSLAEEESLEKYNQYIYNPKYFMGEFIRKCVDEYVNQENPKLKGLLEENLKEFQDLGHSAIVESTEAIQHKRGNASMWLNEFHRILGDNLYVSRRELKTIEHHKITDLKIFKETMTKTLTDKLQKLKNDFATTDLDPFLSKPHEILHESLIAHPGSENLQEFVLTQISVPHVGVGSQVLKTWPLHCWASNRHCSFKEKECVYKKDLTPQFIIFLLKCSQVACSQINQKDIQLLQFGICL